MASTCCPQQKKRQYSTDTTCKINFRRRELYKQLLADKKESLLSQRRSKQFESRSQCILFDYIEEASCSKAGNELHRQTILTIREPSSPKRVVDISCTEDMILAFSKGKAVTDHFSVFELGSTSTAPHEQHNPSALVAITSKGLTSAALCEQHGPSGLAITSKGILNNHQVPTSTIKDNFHLCGQPFVRDFSCTHACHLFVEIMPPVLSRDAWRCVWHMIQNDLVHGWGS